MLDGMIRLLPTADVGFVGLARDEESLVAATYANRLPANLSGRECSCWTRCWPPAGPWRP